MAAMVLNDGARARFTARDGAGVATLLHARAPPARSVVLVPYAQLMPQARKATRPAGRMSCQRFCAAESDRRTGPAAGGGARRLRADPGPVP